MENEVKVENGWRELKWKYVGKKGRYIQMLVLGKDGRELKMVMMEVERFWDEKELGF